MDRNSLRGGLARVGGGFGGGGFLGGGSGAAGLSASENAKITGFTSDQTRLLVKRLDAAGAVTGDAFEVRVRVVGDVIGQQYGYNVNNNTIPSLNVGQYILIAQINVWDGTQYVFDYWTLDLFALRGCE